MRYPRFPSPPLVQLAFSRSQSTERVPLQRKTFELGFSFDSVSSLTRERDNRTRSILGVERKAGTAKGGAETKTFNPQRRSTQTLWPRFLTSSTHSQTEALRRMVLQSMGCTHTKYCRKKTSAVVNTRGRGRRGLGEVGRSCTGSVLLPVIS